ncbi:hypothetical protein OH77DRAFT_22494 [Trametes cingulata]|nr:hypothetical protein OH77DRAFT_22494 [Trametes cingulata]
MKSTRSFPPPPQADIPKRAALGVTGEGGERSEDPSRYAEGQRVEVVGLHFLRTGPHDQAQYGREPVHTSPSSSPFMAARRGTSERASSESGRPALLRWVLWMSGVCHPLRASSADSRSYECRGVRASPGDWACWQTGAPQLFRRLARLSTFWPARRRRYGGESGQLHVTRDGIVNPHDRACKSAQASIIVAGKRRIADGDRCGKGMQIFLYSAVGIAIAALA